MFSIICYSYLSLILNMRHEHILQVMRREFNNIQQVVVYTEIGEYLRRLHRSPWRWPDEYLQKVTAGCQDGSSTSSRIWTLDSQLRLGWRRVRHNRTGRRGRWLVRRDSTGRRLASHDRTDRLQAHNPKAYQPQDRLCVSRVEVSRLDASKMGFRRLPSTVGNTQSMYLMQPHLKKSKLYL